MDLEDYVNRNVEELIKASGNDRENLWNKLLERLMKCGIQSIYWNNFHAKMPGGVRRTDLQRSHHPNTSMKHKDVYPDDVNISEKRKNQTLYEFYETIDDAIVEVGFTTEQVIETRIKAKNSQEKRKKQGPSWKWNTYEHFEEDWKEFHDIMVPTYLKLREWGYNHYPDLIR